MNILKFDSSEMLRTFRVSSDKHEFIIGAMPKLIDEGEINKIHIPGSKYEFHGGFKKIIVEVETDENNMIVQFYAVIDVFYVPPSYLIKENQTVKLGRVIYSGKLDKSNSANKSKWNTQIIVSSPFNENNSSGLPIKVRQIGTGAIISAVVQSLFGTLDGIKLLNLEDYKIPDVEAGTTEIKVTD